MTDTETKKHVIKTRGTRQQMIAECTCGWNSKIARLKVVSGRLLRHTAKTGHEWEPSK